MAKTLAEIKDRNRKRKQLKLHMLKGGTLKPELRPSRLVRPEYIGTRMPIELVEDLNSVAEHYNVSRSDLIRMLLAEGMARMGHDVKLLVSREDLKELLKDTEKHVKEMKKEQEKLINRIQVIGNIV